MIDTLYILSSGRSGSTLLDLILGTHSAATAVSELTQLPRDLAANERCTCGSTIRECDYWREVLGRAAQRLRVDILARPLDLNLGFISTPSRRFVAPLNEWYERRWRLRHALIYAAARSGVPLPAFMRRRFDIGVTNTLAMHEIVREVSGRPLVVDASKAYLKGIALYRRRPANTRLILLSRDGRASFYSRLRGGFDRRHSLRAWRNYYTHALPLLEKYVPPEHVFRIKYEDLATDTESQVRRLCEFAGLEFEPGMLDLKSKVHHITSGNDMRLRSDARIRLDTAWRTGLLPADTSFFESAAGAVNRRLGYE